MPFNEWKPNAPALKKHFSQTPRPAQKRIASVIEIKRLEKERKPPAPQLNLKMQGADAIAARAQASRQRETKIAEVKKQLATQRDQARKNFQRFR